MGENSYEVGSCLPPVSSEVPLNHPGKTEKQKNAEWDFTGNISIILDKVDQAEKKEKDHGRTTVFRLANGFVPLAHISCP